MIFQLFFVDLAEVEGVKLGGRSKKRPDLVVS